MQTRLVARFRQTLLLLDARARELQRAPRVARDAQPRGLLQQRMYLGLHLAAPLVGAVIRAPRQSRRRGLRAAARAPGAVPRRLRGRRARPRAPARHRGRERPRGDLGHGRRRRAARAGVAVVELVVIAASGLGRERGDVRGWGQEVPGRSGRARHARTRARGRDAGTRGRSGRVPAHRVVAEGDLGNGKRRGKRRRIASVRGGSSGDVGDGGWDGERARVRQYVRAWPTSRRSLRRGHRRPPSRAGECRFGGRRACRERKRSTRTYVNARRHLASAREVKREVFCVLVFCREGCLEY